MSLTPSPTVIIPVFNAAEDLKACLDSVSATVGSDTQVIVIDDASSDPQIARLLAKAVQAGGPRWRMVRQPRNAGFVATANLGMRLSHTGVVLLNSDTEVTPGWLERIARCLAADERIATVTPWSNNGEIASIPELCKASEAPADAAAIAAVIASTGEPAYPEIPTAVGFCMAISRRAMERVGCFDEEHFGPGYGEENDFCMRARELGFRNVLCDDAYVVHHGGSSFGPLGIRPGDESMGRLLERHPGYLERVRAFIAEDPLARRRAELCAAVADAGLSFG